MLDKIRGRGIHQADMYELIKTEFETKFNATLTKLDNDSGVTDENYNALLAVSYGGDAAGGESQGNILTFLNSLATNLVALFTKLDNDATVNETDYWEELYFVNLINNASSGNLYDNGVNQGNLVNFCNTIRTAINALHAKLDGDSGVNDTDYNGNDISDVIDTAGCSDN